MPVRFLFDEHIPKQVATALRERAIDIFTIQDARRIGKPDADQLEFSTQERRVLVTFDHDYLRIAAAGVSHTGIVYCTRKSRGISELVKGLVLLNEVLTQEEMVGKVEFL